VDAKRPSYRLFTISVQVVMPRRRMMSVNSVRVAYGFRGVNKNTVTVDFCASKHATQQKSVNKCVRKYLTVFSGVIAAATFYE